MVKKVSRPLQNCGYNVKGYGFEVKEWVADLETFLGSYWIHRNQLTTRTFYFYFRLTTLKEHVLRHIALKPFPCPLCSRRYNTEKLLRRHKLTHNHDKVKREKVSRESRMKKYVQKLNMDREIISTGTGLSAEPHLLWHECNSLYFSYQRSLLICLFY